MDGRDCWASPIAQAQMRTLPFGRWSHSLCPRDPGKVAAGPPHSRDGPAAIRLWPKRVRKSYCDAPRICWGRHGVSAEIVGCARQ
jgi:hypothetical protein